MAVKKSWISWIISHMHAHANHTRDKMRVMQRASKMWILFYFININWGTEHCAMLRECLSATAVRRWLLFIFLLSDGEGWDQHLMFYIYLGNELIWVQHAQPSTCCDNHMKTVKQKVFVSTRHNKPTHGSPDVVSPVLRRGTCERDCS